MNFSEKEIDALEEELGAEQLLVKKFKLYAQTTNDPQLKTKCEQIAAKHQNDYDRLLSRLNG